MAQGGFWLLKWGFQVGVASCSQCLWTRKEKEAGLELGLRPFPLPTSSSQATLPQAFTVSYNSATSWRSNVQIQAPVWTFYIGTPRWHKKIRLGSRVWSGLLFSTNLATFLPKFVFSHTLDKCVVVMNLSKDNFEMFCFLSFRILITFCSSALCVYVFEYVCMHAYGCVPACMCSQAHVQIHIWRSEVLWISELVLFFHHVATMHFPSTLSTTRDWIRSHYKSKPGEHCAFMERLW